MTWAEHEVAIAKENNKDEYYNACLDSALKAYRSMEEDGHSGGSWTITTNILYRLLQSKPLTPITDKDFEGLTHDIFYDEDFLKEHGLKDQFQCPRMSSLFKQIHLDGSITYTDTERVTCYEMGKNLPFYFGIASAVVDEMFPITLPYTGDIKYTVYVKEYLIDPKNGDFDTVVIDSIKVEDKDLFPVHRYFHEEDGKMVEITKEKFEELNFSLFRNS